MRTSLNELVERAISDAERSKVASVTDPSKGSDDAVVTELFGKGKEVKAPAPAQAVSKTAGVKLASEGVKLAQALRAGASILTEKLAEDPGADTAVAATAGSPVALEANNSTTFTAPKAQSNGAAAKVDAKPVMVNATDLRTNENDLAQDGVEGVTPGDGQKLSALHAELLTQRETLGIYHELGVESLVNETRSKVAALEARIAEAEKVAQDPSSPQPDMPAHSKAHFLETNAGEGLPVSTGHLPETNAGIIAMKRDDAQNPSVRSAGAFLSETPVKDNAVQAALGMSEGLKISSEQGGVAFPARSI